MDGYLDQISARFAAMQDRLDAIEAHITPEALQKTRDERAAKATEARLAGRVAAKQAEVAQADADMKALQDQPGQSEEKKHQLEALKAKSDALKAELEDIKTAPEREAKAAALMQEADQLRHPTHQPHAAPPPPPPAKNAKP